MIVPLIAGCLVLAMIAGMVLTMFSANPYFSGIAGQAPASPRAGNTGRAAGSGPAGPSSASRSATSTPSAGTSRAVASLLPDGKLSVAGKRVILRKLTGTALAIVPANCDCAGQVRRLLSQAMSAGVVVYLVGSRGSLAELKNLAPATARGTAMVAIDADNALQRAYRPSGLTVLLVDSHRVVTVASKLRPDFQMEPTLLSLKRAP